MNIKTKTFISAITALLLTGVLGAHVGIPMSSESRIDSLQQYEIRKPVDISDTVTYDNSIELQRKYLPGEIRDTAELFSRKQRAHDYSSKISLLTRSYGDSIVLRWAAEDYVSWQYLNSVGVDVLRGYIDNDGYHLDTLATALKPWTLEQFKATYPESDSIAAMAMGMLYGEGKMRQDQSQYAPGSIGALMDVHGDQQMTFGFAVLVSEWRSDLAERMAMRFMDRNVKKNVTYSYFIAPTVADSTGHVYFANGVAEDVKVEKYKPEVFDTEIGDSLVSPNNIRLWWDNNKYSSYEIERREAGKQEWERVNSKPYIMFMEGNNGEDCFISDEVPHPGKWEYRIFAHDPFGDLTSPSHIYTATVKDIEAPRAPEIVLMEIDRRDSVDLSKDVYATIVFRKDTIEQDLVGYMPMYYHEKVNDGKWLNLCEKNIAPTDTIVTINVTGLPVGQVTIAAYDTAHNVSYALPRIIRITDMKAPDAPKNVKAKTSFANNEKGEPVGLVEITWDVIENDDIDYYEIIYANDTTHQFMQQKHGIVRGATNFIDTLAVDVNQKYIYYKVRAIDYSTNMGEYSELLQVIRPSLVPPSVAHLDSAYVDGKGVYMKWVAGNDEQMAYHKVYRKLIDTDKTWTLIKVCDADSVKAANDFIEFLDKPKENSYEEYAYAIESFNYSDISSGLSLQYVTRYTGDLVFSADIKVVGAYDAENEMTKLAWESSKLPSGKDWYFCIWRKGPEDDRFKFFISAEPDERDYYDRLLNAGETAEYYIQIQMEDGRESEPSNVVTIKAPDKK